MPNPNEQAADLLIIHTIVLQRVAAWLQTLVLTELERLQTLLSNEIATGVLRPRGAPVSRLQALLTTAQGHIFNTYKAIDQVTLQTLLKVAAVEDRKAAQVVNRALGASVMTPAQTEDQLAALVRGKLIQGRHAWEFWHAQQKAIEASFHNAIRAGVALREGVGPLQQRVRGTKQANFTDGIMNVPKFQAASLVRTLVQTVANRVRLVAFQAAAAPAGPIKAVALYPTLDGRSSSGCAALAGKQWSLPDYEPIGHEEPFPGHFVHHGCRSALAPVLLGPVTKPETAAAFLDRQPAARLDAIIGPQRGHWYRQGKLTPTEALDQRTRPLPVTALTAMVDKGHSVPVPRFREGEGGLSLEERALLNRSHAAATQDGKVLSHFLDAHTGQSVAFEGTSPTPEAREAAAGFGKLVYLRGSLTNGAVFLPHELVLMAALPNFSVARLVSPDGSVVSLKVQKGQTFTQADALLLNERLHILKNTAALNPLAKIHAALGLSSRVKMGAKITSVLVLDRPPGTIRLAPLRPVAA